MDIQFTSSLQVLPGRLPLDILLTIRNQQCLSLINTQITATKSVFLQQLGETEGVARTLDFEKHFQASVNSTRFNLVGDVYIFLIFNFLM